MSPPAPERLPAKDVFEQGYADAYDPLYQDKDYGAECDAIERIFRDHTKRPVESVLDLGCGTGSHAIELAKRGYSVVGVDRSKAMLDHARAKSRSIATDALGFVLGDVRDLDLHRDFDAAIMMFAVLGYQIQDRDVIATLASTRHHLKQGGLFIFDCWFGPAVISQGPSARTKTSRSGDAELVRVATGDLNVTDRTCVVNYQLITRRGYMLVSENRERHLVRYFFKPELDLLLRDAGFSLLRLGAFPEPDREPDETTWNVLGVARAETVGAPAVTARGTRR